MRKYFFIFITLAACKLGIAQNNASPYSIIGIGDIEKSFFDRTSGMGHAGLALSSNRYMYMANPASFSTMDQHFFQTELSARYMGVNYTGTPVSSNTSTTQSSDVQFRKLTLAVKIKPKWAIAFGFMPFSTASYSFYSNKNIQGTNLNMLAYYNGIGGVNQAFLTNSFAVTKNFSIGLQSTYLFGQLQQTETLSGTFDSTLITTRNIAISKPYFKLGLQYRAKISSNWRVALGATGATQTRLNANYSLVVTDGNTSSNIVNNQYYKSNYFTLPNTYSGGIAATLKDKYTFAVDYTHQSWSDLNYKGAGYNLVNSQRVNVGFEYSKKVTYREQTIEKSFMQAGFFYDQTYLDIFGHQIIDIGGTIGTGVNIARAPQLSLFAALEAGRRGTIESGLIRENYVQVTVTINYRDFWLPKNFKRYD
ncbi:MAG: hypothetical protein KGO81_04000 [Bacteroidota bacterium]|nr:hypothetical protein [Bacteroidota bacterium]